MSESNVHIARLAWYKLFILSENVYCKTTVVTTTNATVKLEQQFVSCETERSVQTASCLEAGSNLTTKNWQPILILYQTQWYIWKSEEMNWDLRGGCQESGHHPIVHQHLGTSAPEIHTGNTYKTIRQLGSISWGVNFFSIAFLIICQKDNRTK